MLDGMRILGLITARGGSKSIFRKNLKILAGKPLIAWTIEEALKSRLLDRLILSSDDAEIIATAQKYGCEVPFTRPAELARDETPGIDPVIHALQNISGEYDYVVLLQPTSPLRTAEDIDDCIAYCLQAGAPVCVTVRPATEQPCWMHTIDEKGRLRPLLELGTQPVRRQEAPQVFVENGAVYIAQTDYLRQKKNFITPETLAYLMPRERSWDIDNEEDFLYCALLLDQAANRRQTQGSIYRHFSLW